MNNDNQRDAGELAQAAERELKSIGEHWLWFLVLGVLLVIGGAAALAYPWISSVGAVLVLGAILIVGGIATIVGSFWAGKWSALLLQMLVGILYVMAGMAIRDAPVGSTAVLTMFWASVVDATSAFTAKALLPIFSISATTSFPALLLLT